jgi:2-dehydropantoate 2-reductase
MTEMAMRAAQDEQSDRQAGRIVIAGAGSIGCFVGGLLAAAGRDVVLLGRRRLVEELGRHGLRVTSFGGLDIALPAGSVAVSDDPAVLREAALVLVCVKSADTPAMAAIIAAQAPAGAVVVSLQNGVANVEVLQRALPGRVALGGMVPFNVVALGDGRFHRATSGDIVVAAGGDVAPRLAVPGLTVRESDRIAAVQWGKLLVNLNNALNALSGLPLRQQLSSRPWRRLLADQIDEALAVLAAAGIAPQSTTPLPPHWTPRILRLPDALFRLVAGAMIRIDPQARSSMWEDLQRGRATEIDYLQGEVIALALRHGVPVPLTVRIRDLVKAAEGRGGSPGFGVDHIRGG